MDGLIALHVSSAGPNGALAQQVISYGLFTRDFTIFKELSRFTLT